jgi:hypothetical protein
VSPDGKGAYVDLYEQGSLDESVDFSWWFRDTAERGDERYSKVDAADWRYTMLWST